MYTIKETASHFPEMDKALLFKMACNQEDYVNSLLSYYRDRINDFDKERSEWLQKLNEIVTTESEKHKLQWELTRRRDDVNTLKETLDKFRSILYQERQNVLVIQRENELLKLKDLEDQKKITELGALVEPVQENVVLNKNKKPEINYAFSKVDTNIHRNRAAFETALKKVGKDGLVEGQPKCVITNIHLPVDGINSIEQENFELREQIEKDKEIWMEKLETLKLQILDREQKIQQNNNQKAQKIEELQKKAQELEKQHIDLSKELFVLRIQTNEKERKLQEENELQRLKNTALANKILIIEKQAEQENKQTQNEANKISMNAANVFRNQVRSKEENIQILKDQFNQVQKIYLNKIKRLEEDLSGLNEKYEKLDQKRKVQNSGYKSDIKILQTKIETIRRQLQQDGVDLQE
ncbi:coiled-coil protein, putative (macronuclear) [Tetrahymena thermophila SB210]|uniref:Coiled-coil protein, putative n=1 Tax=Tetrahymena thermophila (strain SB210) TaxID=312017 RepID=I7MMU5_TETTS|nr:coiled-coil protein, putative [Tetrahymena thermophila SB210]EAS06763.2 coiled-coil protein, putative [Tetrahymena thermophila SB210]|eukprot:XP_001027005.2 coiled-coil protein, putative [Tetrahymena thermophila SB210]